MREFKETGTLEIMNRSKVLIGVAGLGVILLVIAANYWGFFKSKTGPEARKAQREAILKDDRKNLQKTDAKEDEIRNALMRLAAAQDPLALEESLKRAQDPSIMIRSAVAFALGRYDDPRVLGALQTLLEDSSEEVRRDAIRGMGSRANEERRALLVSMRSKDAMSPTERVALWEVLLRGDPEGKYKNEALVELTAFARSTDSLVKMQATGLLASKFKGDARVVSILKEKLLGAQDPQDRVLAFHHLLSMRDPWVIENYKKLSIDSALPELQNVGIQLIGRACPPKYWEILEQKMSDPAAPIEIKSASLQALASLGGDQAWAVFDQWVSSGRLKDPTLESMQTQVRERLIRTRGRPGRCETNPAPGSSPQADH